MRSPFIIIKGDWGKMEVGAKDKGESKLRMDFHVNLSVFYAALFGGLR